jgi:hypothetical protein
MCTTMLAQACGPTTIISGSSSVIIIGRAAELGLTLERRTFEADDALERRAALERGTWVSTRRN